MIAPVLLLALAFFAGVATATGFDSSAVEIGALTIVALRVCAGAAPRWSARGPAGGAPRAGDGRWCAPAVRLGTPARERRPARPRQRGRDRGRAAGGVDRRDRRRSRRTGGASSRCGSRRSPSRWGARAPPSMARCCSTPPSGRPTTTGIGFAGRCGSAISRPARPPNSATYFQERGIAATGTAQDLKVLDTGQGNSLRAAVGSARTSVDRALARAPG